ncbi:MAG: FHA domain-containing protein [Gemmataceae bacterium]|nr:FHA domain-containing protein [Gemmataceae bacterium]
MNFQGKGELVPVGGGDTIPLLRERLTMGRRESCDICLRFPNVSGQHCEMSFSEGVWYVRDLGSTNGTKVNGQRVQTKALRPGDEIQIAKRRYTIQYHLAAGHIAFQNLVEEDISSQSLLEKAGLAKPKREVVKPKQRIEVIEAEFDDPEPTDE